MPLIKNTINKSQNASAENKINIELDLVWVCSSPSLTYMWLGYNLFSVSEIGFRPLIPEPL